MLKVLERVVVLDLLETAGTGSCEYTEDEVLAGETVVLGGVGCTCACDCRRPCDLGEDSWLALLPWKVEALRVAGSKFRIENRDMREDSLLLFPDALDGMLSPLALMRHFLFTFALCCSKTS